MANKKSQNKDVYYVSLLAADHRGKPLNEYYTFDEGSRIDLEGTGVKFLDVQELVNQYTEEHKWRWMKGTTVYYILEQFMKKNPDASFFVDECPLILSWSLIGGR